MSSAWSTPLFPREVVAAAEPTESAAAEPTESAAAEPTESAAAEPTESAAAEAEPAVDGSDGWAAANHRQVPLKKHDGEWVTYSYDYYSHYECCWCTDKGSAYCCTPTSPTQNYIKGGSSYNGSGDQTSESSYKSGTKEYFCG